MRTRTFHEDLFFEHMKPYRPEGVEKNALNICLDSNPMLETYGADYEFVLKADPNYLWTLLEADGALYITSGRHFVNRIGYYITELPHHGLHLEFRMGRDEPALTAVGLNARKKTLDRMIETYRKNHAGEMS